MKLCNDIKTLKAVFGRRLRGIILDMEKWGHDPIVIETLRTAARQAHLYNKGRSGVKGEVPVTWKRHSKHQDGEAADVISKKRGWGDTKFFEDLEKAARANGCKTFDHDQAHVELVI